MASGERITVTYSHPNRSQGGEPLKLDVYAFVPPVDPVDPNPTFSSRNRLPFILFLHGGHFVTGSRRDVPAWLASLARDNGMPLLCADYRLAPHAGPSCSYEDVQALWRFLREDLNWIIACSGNGAEVESGNEMLEHDFSELQRRGGIDINRGVVVGLGSGGFLAALGGALLSPAPLALILGYPMLEVARQRPDGPGYFVPANTPGHLRPLLDPAQVGNQAAAKVSVPDMPMTLDKAPYAMDLRAGAGMDVHEPWHGKAESVRRQGAVEFLLKDGRLDAMLRKASPDLITPEELLLSSYMSAGTKVNRPYPPTLIFHGIKDTWISPSSSKRFFDVIQRVEPVAAAMDALADGVNHIAVSEEARLAGQATQCVGSGTRQHAKEDPDAAVALRCTPLHPNVTSRYLYLTFEGHNAGHGFDALLPRELRQAPFSRVCPRMIGDRYKTSLVHVERFIRHWVLEGSAEQAAAAAAAAAARRQNEHTDGEIVKQQPDHGGSRIRVPRRGPRL
jgi:acetyl esterase/lipase